VKYVILIYENPTNWKHPMFLQHESLTEEERAGLKGEADALWKEITETGEFIDAGALADPSTTRTIRAVNGVPAITDGPYPEAKEQLAGFFVFDCESQERALEIAARFPDTRFGAVVVRRIMDLSEMQM
jgi:hypothetical protein